MTPGEAAAEQREVTLTTTGRKSGKQRKVTIWISTDGRRLFIRSGQGLKREWPQNLLAKPEAKLHLGGKDIRVKARLVTDPHESRAIAEFGRKKYGSYIKPSKAGEPLSESEKATFELIPAD